MAGRHDSKWIRRGVKKRRENEHAGMGGGVGSGRYARVELGQDMET